MGKGADQGDFETTAPVTAWPDDTTTMTVAPTPDAPSPTQLPTTSGANPVVIGCIIVFAVIVLAIGIIAARHRRGKDQW
jgi:hypothetical protein